LPRPGRSNAPAPEELLHERRAHTHARSTVDAVALVVLQVGAALRTVAGPAGRLSAGGRQAAYSRPREGRLWEPNACSGAGESNAFITAVVPPSWSESAVPWTAALGERSMSVAPHCQQ